MARVARVRTRNLSVRLRAEETRHGSPSGEAAGLGQEFGEKGM